MVAPIAGVAEGEDRAGVLVGAGRDDPKRGGLAESCSRIAPRCLLTACVPGSTQRTASARAMSARRAASDGRELVEHVADDEQADWLGGGE